MKAVSLRRLSWARLVSDVCSPPVILSILAVTLAQEDARTLEEAIFLAGFYILLSVLIPFATLAWWVRQGFITDIHMPERAERYWPLATSLLCSFLAWLGVRITGQYVGMKLLTSFMLIETFFVLVLRHTGN